MDESDWKELIGGEYWDDSIAGGSDDFDEDG
jgi:hypothetical protein